MRRLKLEFKYYILTAEKRDELFHKLKRRLAGVEEILFAYVHGGFLEGEFRDVDVAVWIRDSSKEPSTTPSTSQLSWS